MSVSQVLGSLGVPEGTASDGTVDTSINLHNVTQLKDLVDLGLSPEQRAQHAGALLDGITAPAGQPGVSLLHRLIGHVVGNDELSQEDHAQLAAALPITAHVTTQVTPGGTAQPAPGGTAQTAPGGTAQPVPGGTAQAVPGGTGQTAPGGTASPAAGPPMQVSTVWDVSTPDGSLRVIELPNGIELLDGGCVVARSTPLHFTCSSLTRAGAPPAGYSGDFNILGTTGAPVATPAQPPGRAQAPSGAPGTCVSASVAGDGGGNGAPGQQGTAGAAGPRGNDGIASALASITITGSLTVDQAAKKVLVVATQSGPGGPGGNGGPGGPGQQGGNGGNGVTCDCTGTGGGAAGPGGRGGSGGQAGDGGNGTDAAGNIAVFLPTGTSTSLVQPAPAPAPPGPPGQPGPGGPGGAPGTPGAAGKNSSVGATAAGGPPGNPGSPGNPGTHTGTAAQVTVTIM